MREARIRLRSIRPKSGGAEIRVLHGPDPDEDRRYAEEMVGGCLDHYRGQRIAGFAFVVWGPNTASVAFSHVDDSSRIPKIMVPDFARERLMAEIVERWARE